MKIIYVNSIEDVKPLNKNSNLILGNFDGIHIGHSQLINFAKQNSKGELGVLTFSHSLKGIGQCLMSLEDKLSFLSKIDIDFVIILAANESIKHVSSIDFIQDYLRVLNPERIFCGPDFKFGYLAQGNVQLLKQYFSNLCVLNFVNDHNGNKIASTEIRNCILNGEIEKANRWLGHNYQIKGVVVHGKGKGKQIGFPTANIECEFNYVLPRDGVYITLIDIKGIKYKSITNIGTCPTVSSSSTKTIETFVFDFKEDLYGELVKLTFIKFLREEQKFANLDELAIQLQKDREIAEEYLENEI